MPLVAPPLVTNIVVAFDGRTQIVPLTEQVIVGHSEMADVRVKDRHIGRRHVRIQRCPGGFEVCDLGSENGTYLNGNRIDREMLRVGDQVSIGGTTRIWFDHTLATGGWPDGAAPLVAAVLEDPDDDGPRCVLADWLQQRDDPRGELIACQIFAETANATAGLEAGARERAVIAARAGVGRAAAGSGRALDVPARVRRGRPRS